MKPPTFRLLVSAALCLAFVACTHVPSHVATQPVPREGSWLERHRTFNDVSRQGTAQLVFLGDSITQGWEKAGASVWAKRYAGRQAANFGIGGDRTEHVLWRLANGNFDGLSPRLIVLMIGTNNTGHSNRPPRNPGEAMYICTAEQTADGVAAILQALKRKMPQTKVLLLGIFPRGEKPSDPLRQQNEATNALIARLADGKRVQYLDIGNRFLEPDGTLTRAVMPDLLHLSERGYAIWADAIEPRIAELLGER